MAFAPTNHRCEKRRERYLHTLGVEYLFMKRYYEGEDTFSSSPAPAGEEAISRVTTEDGPFVCACVSGFGSVGTNCSTGSRTTGRR
jgi:hypothetical protein